MKPISFFLVGTMLLLASCSEEIDNTTTGTTAEPGTYIVGINLNMEVPLTKGINYEENGVFSFDSNYSCDSIYLHNGNKFISIPVSEIAECGEGCKGFTYKICTDNGQTTITPIKADGSESDEKLQIDSNDLTYFSSSSKDIWHATESGAETVPHDASAKLYKRTQENNVELFRSTENLTVEALQNGGQLNMKRVCSGFTFFCTFTDRTDNELTEEDFEEHMSASPEDFYIKIYIGGPAFTDTYNVTTQKGNENATDRYYASGDSFKKNDYGNTDPVSLRDSISSNLHGLGYGYATLEGNELITPISRNGSTVVGYIYITHNNQTVYTRVQTTVYVEEGNFYRIGADIDILELKEAFDNYNNLPTSASADTRSASAPRLFTPKSLITHIEY